MRKRTWFMLLIVIAAVSLLFFTGCPNDTVVEEELFSFNAVGLNGRAINSTDAGVNWTLANNTNTTNFLSRWE